MRQVIIRDVEERDFLEIKKIIDQTWGFEKLYPDKAALDTALGIYFNQVLYGCSFGKAAILDNKIVGVIFGSANGEKPKYRMMLEDSTKQILTLLTLPESYRKNIYEYTYKLCGAYDELLESKADLYKGTLDFLIVSEEARGLKIGQKLWEEISLYFQKNNAESIYVFTDTNCNYGFYEHLGFSMKEARDIEFVFGSEHLPLKIFLYDYRFNN